MKVKDIIWKNKKDNQPTSVDVPYEVYRAGCDSTRIISYVENKLKSKIESCTITV